MAKRARVEMLDETLFGGRYRVTGHLGSGGAGDVFSGVHEALGTAVAIKILKPEHAADPQQRERWRIESQSLGRLRHRNLAETIDAGVLPDGRLYSVMLLVAGRSLRDELKARGPLPWREASVVTQGVLAGLAEAHKLGIVHRDVKAANVMYGPPTDAGERDVRVIDFGIAKLLGTSDPRAPAPSKFPTTEGLLVGSLGSTAPEQIKGGAIDPRVDVYGAAALLYKLVTGRGPFDHLGNELAILIAQAQETPQRPSEIVASALPAAFDDVVMKALATQPSDRFSTAEAFSSALAAVLAAPGELGGRAGTELMSTTPLARAAKPSDAAPNLPVAPRPTTTEPLPPEVPARALGLGPQGTEMIDEIARVSAPRPDRRLFVIVGFLLAAVVVLVGWIVVGAGR